MREKEDVPEAIFTAEVETSLGGRRGRKGKADEERRCRCKLQLTAADVLAK